MKMAEDNSTSDRNSTLKKQIRSYLSKREKILPRYRLCTIPLILWGLYEYLVYDLEYVFIFSISVFIILSILIFMIIPAENEENDRAG